MSKDVNKDIFLRRSIRYFSDKMEIIQTIIFYLLGIAVPRMYGLFFN